MNAENDGSASAVKQWNGIKEINTATRSDKEWQKKSIKGDF